MSVEGSLDLFSLPEILQLISQQAKTGILTIQGQQDIVAISFLGGRIVAADSLAHTIEERLGKVLVGERLLTAAQLARANAENQGAGGRLLDLLVDRGYLSRQQLLAALRLQTTRHVEELLHWQEGEFKFYGGDEVSYEEGFEPISVEDLLLHNLEGFGGPAPATSSSARPRPATATVPSRAAAETGASAPRTGGTEARAAGNAAVDRGRGQPDDGARTDSGTLWMPPLPELPEAPATPAPATAAGSPGAAPLGAREALPALTVPTPLSPLVPPGQEALPGQLAGAAPLAAPAELPRGAGGRLPATAGEVRLAGGTTAGVSGGAGEGVPGGAGLGVPGGSGLGVPGGAGPGVLDRGFLLPGEAGFSELTGAQQTGAALRATGDREPGASSEAPAGQLDELDTEVPGFTEPPGEPATHLAASLSDTLPVGATAGWAPLATPPSAVPPAPPAGATAGSAQVPPASVAAEPVPWPAAVISPPADPPPARPRPSGARVVKRPGSPAGAAAAWTGAGAGAATGVTPSPGAGGGRSGLSPAPPLIPPDSAAAAARARSAAGAAMEGAAAAGAARPGVAPAGRAARGSQAAAAAIGGTATTAPALPRHFRLMQLERPEREVLLRHRLAAAVLAVAAAASLIVAVWRLPQAALLPFPWQREERAALVRNQRESLFDKIDGAAKAAFLRDGRFPDQLAQLVDSGLLSFADLEDPSGGPLRYVAREDSYTLQATEAGKPLPEAETSGSIAGNFLLDPALLQSGTSSGPPIVLLD
jgi:hypothetical protein